MGVGPLIEPTGNFDADMLRILDIYDGVSPRNAKGWDIDLLRQTYSRETKK
jgi:hypothetical protein